MSPHYADISGGYWMFARKTYDSWVWKLPAAQFKVWCYIMGRARYAETPDKYFMGDELITVHRGQFITSYPSAAAACGVSVKVVITVMRRMKREGAITMERVGKGTLVTVCNYHRYQDPDSYVGQAEVQDKGRIGAESGHEPGQGEVQQKNNERTLQEGLKEREESSARRGEGRRKRGTRRSGSSRDPLTEFRKKIKDSKLTPGQKRYLLSLNWEPKFVEQFNAHPRIPELWKQYGVDGIE